MELKDYEPKREVYKQKDNAERAQGDCRPDIDMLLQALIESRIEEKGEQAEEHQDAVAAMAPILLDGRPMTLAQTSTNHTERFFCR